jgi:TolB-like protein/Flp pilus assembly protein TadD
LLPYDPDTMASVFQRLRQRKIVQWAIAYVAGAWLLLELLGFVAENFGWSVGIVRGATVFLGIGFLVTLVLAWYHGEKGQQHATGFELLIIAGLLLVAGAAVAYVSRDSVIEDAQTLAPPTRTIDHRAIAVLPFADMSPEGDQEYFSDGLSEELLNLLAKTPGLLVAARTSSFSFKGQNLEIPEIAERLHVAHVLEGSVRKSGNQLRVTAQLIRAADGFHVWADTWDRSLDDIFAIQDEIAAEVVAQLKITLLGEAPSVEQTDPEAYALYLQARHLGRQHTAEAFEQSNALYEQALAIDPDYAAAWADLASNYINQTGLGVRLFDEGFGLAREAANRALAIDPEFAPAHALLGLIAMQHDHDLAAAARHYERALALNPTNTGIIGGAASLAWGLDRLDEAIALGEYAVAHDPVNSTARHNLGLSYGWAGRFDEAIASFNTELSLSPGSSSAQYGIGAALLLKGEPEAALAAMQQESSDAWRLIGLPMAYHALGQTADSDAVLAQLIEKYEEGAAYNIAYVLAFRGEADRAFEWLDKAVEYSDAGLSEILVEPLFANLHDDPRWLPFLESIGKSPEQLAAIEFNVTLPK